MSSNLSQGQPSASLDHSEELFTGPSGRTSETISEREAGAETLEVPTMQCHLLRRQELGQSMQARGRNGLQASS